MTNLDPTAATLGGRHSDPTLPRDLRLVPVQGLWGFRARRTLAALPTMPLSKRILDLAIAIPLFLLIWPLLLGVIVLQLVKEGRPIFYFAERMSAPGRPFWQIKFRTMRVGADAVGGVSGGNKTRQISPFHRFLRRSRIDELPQIINVIRGEMSLVGPRPPMRCYVEDYPEIYGQVLQSRPGITGLATLNFHQFEERLLAACSTPEETERAYRRICIPRKAKIDMIYQRRWTLWLDLALIWQTARRPFYKHPGRRRTVPGGKGVLLSSRKAGLKA
jgi:lipopolysaccharide/colanic/teichoic acid biosynthesis glycosyltransferase